MKPFAALAVVALSGVLVWQVATALLLPLIGLVFGLVITTAKIALWVAIAYFIYSFFRNRRERVA